MHHHSVTRPVHDGIIVLDYGSQYTLLIARRLREIGLYAEIVDGSKEQPPEDFTFHGVILSGGPDSVTDETARKLPRWVLDSGKPILGICYGMQLLAQEFGGKLRSGHQREYGKATLNLDVSHGCWASSMLSKLPESQTVWMSHGDDVENLTEEFSIIGRTGDGVVAAVAHKEKPYIALQFHPEVQHSECGKELLSLFVQDVCKAKLNWQADDVVEATLDYVKETVADGKVLMAVSGGVDSTVAVALMSQALGNDRVTAVFVDHGLLRKNEASWVKEKIESLGVNLVVLNRAQEFYQALSGVSDPEQKRKIIGLKFIEEFETYAKANEGFTHLGQGTLYPDVIESAGHGAGAKVIKSHHNVGGLPERLHMALVEPFRYLFKDEVRLVGRKVGISNELVDRHPFPGPGLAVRILGEITADKVEILQNADQIFIDKLREKDLYKEVWQAFAVLLPVKTVGVMGDNRTYQWTCALRAVTATDGMTAGVGDLPMEFLVSVSDEIVRKVDGINRVVYDITTKPPATIEWE
ncbi:GMP synthase (glutamine-hydrolyzing) [Pseudobacteriovorax antillogorgiicola]|uniref:GMP synthase [glutamine-hydrolyzing] n=1 Tax=Pseudobacteriovorax antillogorgiicola TaxID=1513793 RepID=A0A1Y6CDB7_9BACT|nr:glutamine-hydrolyzing GMP synthase [Pseudobacteriovorax antillogorgiicola]TCS48583.1 GMP synthase (glutamine-hydrolysing) [Pseudobacteriovorax antillogorgiicola]SMF55680.1 GMP synthase (glutamine-hydrolyzing) [Pseudobacteriovorax antillogorgiicola]